VKLILLIVLNLKNILLLEYCNNIFCSNIIFTVVQLLTVKYLHSWLQVHYFISTNTILSRISLRHKCIWIYHLVMIRTVHGIMPYSVRINFTSYSCCNILVGAVLNSQCTMNRMCANNNTYMQYAYNIDKQE